MLVVVNSSGGGGGGGGNDVQDGAEHWCAAMMMIESELPLLYADFSCPLSPTYTCTQNTHTHG